MVPGPGELLDQVGVAVPAPDGLDILPCQDVEQPLVPHRLDDVTHAGAVVLTIVILMDQDQTEFLASPQPGP